MHSVTSFSAVMDETPGGDTAKMGQTIAVLVVDISIVWTAGCPGITDACHINDHSLIMAMTLTDVMFMAILISGDDLAAVSLMAGLPRTKRARSLRSSPHLFAGELMKLRHGFWVPLARNAAAA